MFLLVPVAALPQWPTSPDNMYIPETGAFPTGITPTVFLPIPDDIGGFYFSHTGSEYGIQHMAADGALLWGDVGVNLPINDYDQTTIADIEPAGDGFLYVLYEHLDVWWDEVYHYTPHLFLVLFNSDGNLVWEEAFQVAADSAHGGLIEWFPADLIRDPSNQGVFVHWREVDSTSFLYKDKFQYIKNVNDFPEEQYLQYGIRLDDPESGIPHLQRSEIKGIFINDDLGFDVFVSAGDTALYFQKYDVNATPLLSNPGVVVAPETFNFTHNTVRPQRYVDEKYLVNKGSRVQIIDNFGNALLSPQEVSQIGSVGRVIPVAGSGSNDLFTWTAKLDSATGRFILFYQWFDSQLNKYYGPDGLAIDTLDGFNWRHPYYILAPDLSVYACRTYPDDDRLYVQRYDRYGQMWDDWVLVNDNAWQPGYQQWTYAIVVSDGALIIPMYGGEEWGFVRISPTGELGGPGTGIESAFSNPKYCTLGMPFPNPFNAQIIIPVYKGGANEYIIGIYDLSGRLVRRLDVGDASFVYWDAKDSKGINVASGVYFVRDLSHSNSVSTYTRKIILQR